MDDLIRKENMQIGVEAASWQDAVRGAGNLLLQAGSITAQYIEEMIQAVVELGPYMVLMPGFALAHAAPSAAVLRDDISLITLKAPVAFGNAENDPVKVVLCICCKDRESHRTTLQRVALSVMEDGMIDNMAAAQSVEDLRALLQNA
jgi:PTS system ascorbate-specific IIA component